MRAILIDPFNRAVSLVTVASAEEARAMVGADVINVAQITAQDHLILDRQAIDKPGMRFWALGNSTDPIGGRGVIRGNTLDGLQAEDVHMDEILLRQAVRFLDIEFLGWKTVPEFGPLQAQQETAQATLPPPAPIETKAEPQGKPWSLWTITEDIDAGYRATLMTVDGQGNAKVTGTVLENEDLEELRNLLPRGLVKLDRSDKDDPSIVETWHTATN